MAHRNLRRRAPRHVTLYSDCRRWRITPPRESGPPCQNTLYNRRLSGTGHGRQHPFRRQAPPLRAGDRGARIDRQAARGGQGAARGVGRHLRARRGAQAPLRGAVAPGRGSGGEDQARCRRQADRHRAARRYLILRPPRSASTGRASAIGRGEIVMSFFPAKDPAPGDARAADAIDLVIVPRSVDVGHFAVRRARPHVNRRMVGPFIFFDHFGPAEFHAGQGIDVRPHPHIGLATVTFLFDGEIMHRDSLGTAAAIRPGEVNWMTAGRGIVHSERTAPEHRKDGEPIHGLQCWVALPAVEEERAPDFSHHDGAARPVGSEEGKTVRVVAGSAYGERSPVRTLSDTLFADVTLTAGAVLPIDAETEERAVYLISGEVDIAGDSFTAGRLLVFRPGDRVSLTAVSDARLVLLGGATMDGPRHIWWNFVSSRKERIEQAKADWKLARFDTVPGDDKEFIPLPE